MVSTWTATDTTLKIWFLGFQNTNDELLVPSGTRYITISVALFRSPAEVTSSVCILELSVAKVKTI